MKPAPPDPAEMLHRVRQQLILAQVRIMELEDERDEARTRLEDVEHLLAAAQKLADQKLDEASHLEKVRAELQAQYEHMRHMQHVTNEALHHARRQTEAVENQHRQVQRDAASFKARLDELSENLASLRQNLDEAKRDSQNRADQIAHLQKELATMRATRSWRWTAWLRNAEQKPGDGKP